MILERFSYIFFKKKFLKKLLIIETLLDIYHIGIHDHHRVIPDIFKFNSTGVREQVRDRVEDTHVYLKERQYLKPFYTSFFMKKVFLKLKMLMVVPNLSWAHTRVSELYQLLSKNILQH